MEYHDRSLESLRRLLLAIRRLTALRVPVRGPVNARDRRESALFYPLVGLLIGVGPALAMLLPLPGGARAVLAVALWIVAAGAVHLRAWTGAVDAASAPEPADADETRLDRPTAARDGRLGAVGAAVLGLAMLGKWVALPHAPFFAPLVAAALARWGIVHALRTYAPARAGAPDAEVDGAVPLWGATWVAVAVLGIITFASPDPGQTALAVTLGSVAALVAAAFLVDRFRGVTWGVCAASAEAAEVAVLWAYIV